MPAAEAEVVEGGIEPVAYELAFHVLPTVAEGEVATVVAGLISELTRAGATIFDQEAAERFDLAYEIEKYLEGRHRHFKSAYFGWVRFRLTPAALEGVAEYLGAHKELLRYLLVRLTKEEEARPFRFHESLAVKRVTTIGSEEEVVEVIPEVAATEVVEEVVVAERGEEVKESV